MPIFQQTIIWGELKHTQQTGSGVYIYNMCVILHGNDLMRMLMQSPHVRTWPVKIVNIQYSMNRYSVVRESLYVATFDQTHTKLEQ